jgi:16S rRNA (adenine1518-N6/adenine1519-N6)-dimethyltransferase
LTSTSSTSNRRRGARPYRPREVRDAGISPTKALGQHFLTDRNVVAKIVAAAELHADEVAVEVGPGLGVLTDALAETAGRLVAVEVDRKLAERLRERFAGADHVSIVEADVLTTTPEALLTAAGAGPDVPYVVVANLPYNIGAAVLRHFLEASHPPRRLVVMLQREVANAITAAPGELGLLGVAIQVYAEPRRLFNVGARAFYPPPKVVSSVIRLDVRLQPLVEPSERDRFFRVVRAGFSAPRKQLRNSLAQGLQREPAAVLPAIEAAGIDPRRRPEDLSIDDWLRLARAFGG